MERKAARTSGHHRSLVVLSVVIVLIAAAAVAVGSSADLRRAVGWTRIHPGYQWLHSGLDQASASAELALTGSRRQAVRSAAEVLRSAILYSRANVRRGRAEPIPEAVKKVLAPFFPGDTLQTVRWSVAGDRLDLGSAVAAWYRSEGGAVTLKDTIVFSDRRTASDIVLWAHELTHVLQFEQLGVRDFARLYAVNYLALEDQARINAGRIERRLTDCRPRLHSDQSVRVRPCCSRRSRKAITSSCSAAIAAAPATGASGSSASRPMKKLANVAVI
jgi:Domain of unknown function (DUF4157)